MNTTRSIICEAQEYLEECDVTIILTPYGDRTFPSVVWIDPENQDEFIVGMDAKQAADAGGSPIMFSKRKIGTTETYKIGDKELTAKDAAVEILKYLKKCAERALGHPVQRAVVTHPAYFERSQVEETREAATLAGFNMLETDQMMMEPISAAIAYIHRDPKDPLCVLIYDLGGGTFDVTLLEKKSGNINVKAYHGNHLLGGYNFDRCLVNYIIQKIHDKGRKITFDFSKEKDNSIYAQLIQLAESIKERLANMGKRKKVPVEIRCNFLVDDEGKNIQVLERITQEQFVELIQEELDDTIEKTRGCLMKVVDAWRNENTLAEHLREAELESLQQKPVDQWTNQELAKAIQLDYVLLVGGSTYGPWVEEIVEKEFGMEPKRAYPDLDVAIGAAIKASQLPNLSGGDSDLQVMIHAEKCSVLRRLDIPGQIINYNPEQMRSFQAILSISESATHGPTFIDDQGKFIFEDVMLLTDEPTQFELEIIDENGTPQVSHPFTVSYEPEAMGSTSIRTVLPRPMYVQTASGLLPLMEEGKELPSPETLVTVTRRTDGPVLEIEIFQEDIRAGSIFVNDIPDSGGRDAKVELRIVITERNEIKGTAKVFAVRNSKQVVKEQKFKIDFPPAQIPNLNDLQDRFQQLEDERAQLLFDETIRPERRMALTGKGGQLATKIQSQLEDINPDRQEIDQTVREFNRLIHPPSNDLDPPRDKFDHLLSECRTKVEEKKNDPQFQAYSSRIEKHAENGMEAYKVRDQRRWGFAYDGLHSIYQKLIEEPNTPQPQLPDTPILKDSALMELSQTRSFLDQARDDSIKKDETKYRTWFHPLYEEDITKIEDMEAKIGEIPDDMNNQVALSKIQVIMRSKKDVEEDIVTIETGSIVKK